MKNKKLSLSLALLFVIMTIFAGCAKQEAPKNEVKEDNQPKVEKTLLVYSGAGLKKPMNEIKEVYKEKTGVDVDYVFAGSTQLLSQMELNKKGDVLIVGAIKAYEKAMEKGLVGDYKTVAYHNPIIGVPKDNPKNIEKLEDLKKDGVKVILGDEKANAIGKTTQMIFKKNHLEDINKNVVSKTPTVNELIVHLTQKDADAAIITVDSAFGNDDIKTIEIPKEQNIKQILPIGVLTDSKEKDEAEKFVEFVSGKEGKEIFAKYGFPPVEDEK